MGGTISAPTLAKSGTEIQDNNLTDGVRAELSPQDRNRFDQLLSAGTDDGDKFLVKTDSGEEPSIKYTHNTESIRKPGIEAGLILVQAQFLLLLLCQV